jgi:hypothetical protein
MRFKGRLLVELKLIQTRMIQKPLLWVEAGKSACVLVGIRDLRLSPPARYDPQCPSLLDFLSGCLVCVLWTCRSATDPARDVDQVTPYHRALVACGAVREVSYIYNRDFFCAERQGAPVLPDNAK